MTEYIERQAALDAIGAEIPEPSAPDFFGVRDYEVHIDSEAFADAGLAVRKVPASDVRPVVHTRWKDGPEIRVDKGEGIPTVQCPKCRLYFGDLLNNHREIYRFCPYCGAQMDGEEESAT